jgi:hypothetical protein
MLERRLSNMMGSVTHLLDLLAHLVLPHLRAWRVLGDEQEVGPARDGGHEREPTAVAPHDLEHERARVREGGRVDVIDRLADALERGRRADGQVRQRHVVVDRANKSGDLEVPMCGCLLLGDLA